MKIIIVAQETDNHTAPIRWALHKAGYPVVCWAGLGWTAERQASISFSGDTRLNLGSCSLESGDIVWIRRPEPPEPNPQVAESDAKFAKAEYRWFSDSLMYLLEMLPVRCINRYSASRRIRNKAVQLALARRCGMKVPRTVMSNSPLAVRNCLRQDAAGRKICKAFFPHIWQKQGNQALAVTEAFEITGEMLPADEVLTYAPAIYQDMVEKRCDIRTLLLGTVVYSYALRNEKEAVDWRQDASQGLVRVEPIETPESVTGAVLAFADQSGIAHGSFDFAMDDKGQWWFLEVNQAGQFLWLDDFNPDVHVQEKFLAFLTSPEGATREVLEERASRFPSWSDYLDSQGGKGQTRKQAQADSDFVSLEQ